MSSSSSSSHDAHSSIPVLKEDGAPGFSYKIPRTGLEYYLDSLSGHFNILTDAEPVWYILPNPFAPGVSVAQRQRHMHDEEKRAQWASARKKGKHAIGVFVKQNPTSFEIIQNLEANAVAAHAVEAAAAILAGDPVPVVAQPTLMQLLTALDNHFDPQDELQARELIIVMNNISIKIGEKCTPFIVKLQACMNDVDRVRNHSLTLQEKKDELERALLVGKEPELHQLVTMMQMQNGNPTWTEIKNLVCRFDRSVAGKQRLQKKPPVRVSNYDSISTIGTDQKCAHCNKPGHDINKCFGLHPELMPKWMKSMDTKKQKSKKRKEADKKTREKAHLSRN